MIKPTIEDTYNPLDIDYYPNWGSWYWRSKFYKCHSCGEQGEYLVRTMYWHMWFNIDMCGECVFKAEASCHPFDCPKCK
jgi:hypothetical protein